MTVDSDDDDSDSHHSYYQFSTPDGLHLARKVLRPLLPYDPHDDQLEGICKMIDGINLMALTRTGSGKTGYFTMYMLFLLALSKDPRIVAPAKKSVPNNPVMVLVFPTNGVEEEMASFTVFSIYLLTSYTYFRNLSSSLTGWRHSQSTRTDLSRLAAMALIFGNWHASMSQCFACPQSSSRQKAFQTFSSISRSGTDFALSEWTRFTCYTTGV
jgi:hypothetical protein